MKLIYRLRDNNTVRAVDIAREFDVKKPTVSVALKRMESLGLIIYKSDRGIDLTEEGERIAREIIERYDVVYGLLSDLGVDEETARADACGMEHGISDQTVKALKELRMYLRDASFEPFHLSRSKDNSL